MVIATLCYAVGPLIIQRHMQGLDSIGPLAASLLVASVILFIPAMIDLPRSLPSTAALSSIAVLGIVCTAVAMLLMFYLVNHAGASRATVITYINPMVATLLGVGLALDLIAVVNPVEQSRPARPPAVPRQVPAPIIGMEHHRPWPLVMALQQLV